MEILVKNHALKIVIMIGEVVHSQIIAEIV